MSDGQDIHPTHDESDWGQVAVTTRPASPRVDRLPPWRVLLHNDDSSEITFVVRSIIALTPLDHEEAISRTREAHETGVSLLLTTHREHAELLEEQFRSKLLTVTIEPE